MNTGSCSGPNDANMFCDVYRAVKTPSHAEMKSHDLAVLTKETKFLL
jgi:hypothetical protein